jgi:hypothetical protein
MPIDLLVDTDGTMEAFIFRARCIMQKRIQRANCFKRLDLAASNYDFTIGNQQHNQENHHRSAVMA